MNGPRFSLSAVRGARKEEPGGVEARPFQSDTGAGLARAFAQGVLRQGAGQPPAHHVGPGSGMAAAQIDVDQQQLAGRRLDVAGQVAHAQEEMRPFVVMGEQLTGNGVFLVLAQFASIADVAFQHEDAAGILGMGFDAEAVPLQPGLHRPVEGGRIGGHVHVAVRVERLRFDTP